MFASEAELGRAQRVLLDGDEEFARVRGYQCDAAAVSACNREHVGPSLKTTEVSDKGPAARAGEGGGPGSAG